MSTLVYDFFLVHLSQWTSSGRIARTRRQVVGPELHRYLSAAAGTTIRPAPAIPRRGHTLHPTMTNRQRASGAMHRWIQTRRVTPVSRLKLSPRNWLGRSSASSRRSVAPRGIIGSPRRWCSTSRSFRQSPIKVIPRNLLTEFVSIIREDRLVVTNGSQFIYFDIFLSGGHRDILLHVTPERITSRSAQRHPLITIIRENIRRSKGGKGFLRRISLPFIYAIEVTKPCLCTYSSYRLSLSW